ncbi:ribonuclease HI family protein [Fructobacillus sp. M2-14]|uniref:Ribonuclease HI family protein n=1 Tax=Fructobacillus broussonetiae TaxID=2713173 RepID=A0ABS5QYN6_9LACO|nr:ribonuclease HI family protein [Fructobacillus broussonetiae]MBS9338305.1 ribonuclease HI family protein [Fructobacillus broussonetiae]
MIQIQTDAAFRKRDEKASAGIIFIKDKVQHPYATILDKCTDNHEAEFMALLFGLKTVQAELSKTEMLEIQSDSKLLVSSMQKRYAKHYQEYVDEILAMLPNPELTFFVWVKDSNNRGPHDLALRALKKD